ncbi:MAG: UDP-N-acetylmuramoyl-L-alanine--D-glutamate ligase [Zoogloeaceae bacterium]|jgi:UDP-N-acetylmuramoylalanine--D-glutamate ligase|nr:UDP-N-acetylmuramoyl-L-alanine--D-glutamate ligase [Zoogloeaceae bacterium]
MELADKHFLVVGLGESGLAMAKWLKRQGAAVRVADSRKNPPNRAALAAFAPDIEVIAGPFKAKTFEGVDAIALSPGVPQNTPEIAAAAGKTEIVSEADLFSDALPTFAPESKVLAITGSNGKTTTTALTAHLLNSAGVEAVACGNISPSLLDALMAALDAGRLPSVWVAELSSFQLEITKRLAAHAATVLNVCEDHLDRYESIGDYAHAKARIFQNPMTLRILNRDDDRSLCFGGSGFGMATFGLNPAPRAGHYGIERKAIYLGEERLIALDKLPLKGLHNAANVMAALALCRTVGVDAKKTLPALRKFKGLPHRVEPVAEINGVLYVDDSKGTNVGATLAAIEGMGRPVAIVLGGDGKGQNFAPLKKALERHGRAVALIGRDAKIIKEALQGAGLPMKSFPSLEKAVRWLAGEAKEGDCVLLSPASASLDMFKDYAHRAEVFVEAVRALEAA